MNRGHWGFDDPAHAIGTEDEQLVVCFAVCVTKSTASSKLTLLVELTLPSCLQLLARALLRDQAGIEACILSTWRESGGMEKDADALTAALLWAIGVDGDPLLTEIQARRRAEAICAEVSALNFDLQLFAWRNVTPAGKLHPYPAYHLDDPRYDLNVVGPGDPGQFAINCPGISCGDLLKLGRACELKRNLLGERWHKDLRDSLRDPQSHLDAIEEILWLGRFRDVRDVRRTVKHANGKDADWGFTACALPLQIEVKNRRRECTGIIDGAHRGREHPLWHEDLAGKFERDERGSLNVACVTTYFAADTALYERARDLLSSGEPVDAVVFWTGHCPGANHVTIFASAASRAVLVPIIAPAAHEDAQKFFLVEHLARNSAEQRVETFEETMTRLRVSSDE